MVEGYSCFLDTDKITSTVETLKSIDNCLSNKDLKDSFFEMEELLNKYNFEHGNFTTSYKDTLEIIEDEITKIKKGISDLGFGVEQTNHLLSNTQEKTVRDVQELSNVYGVGVAEGIPSDSPIKIQKDLKTSIAEVISAGIPEAQPTNNEINTVPIGIGIGVAGAVGAIGAVAYDAIRGKERVKIDDYKPPREEVEERERYLPPKETPDNEFDDATPYYAIHNRDSMSKFYSDDNDNR